jgi:hypothetical protein
MLIAIVLMTIIILSIFLIFSKISSKSEDTLYKSRCKTSLKAYARLKHMPFGDSTTDEAKISCPTQYITIEDASQKSMRRQVANLMAGCWDNMGEGKIRLFSAQDEKFCVICSVFQFEDKKDKLTGLPSFMATEKAPILRKDYRPTYQEFISGVQTSEKVVDKLKNSGIDQSYLDGSKRYAILFTYYKQSYWSKVWRAALGAVVGAVSVVVGGIIIGATLGIGTPISFMVVTAGAGAGAAIAASTGNPKAGVTTEGADWDANIILTEYTPERIKGLGCEELPISQIADKFK